MYYANDVHPVPPDHGADRCDDQLPLISRVGRGPRGESSRLKLTESNNSSEAYLESLVYDEATGEYRSEWVSQNINGGRLSYQYNLRPYTIPRTFTITFIYRRPNQPEWSWTTPAIPYIWTVDPAGQPDEDPDHVVGSGVATLFARTVHDGPWDIERDERLIYPMTEDGVQTERTDFNAPDPEQGWTSNLIFGFGGNIDVPDFDDLAKIIGITKEELYKILQGDGKIPDSVTPDLYPDLKSYIDAVNDRLHNMMDSLNELIYDATVNPDGSITLPPGAKIPSGKLNIFSNFDSYLRTRSDSDGDVRVI